MSGLKDRLKRLTGASSTGNASAPKEGEDSRFTGRADDGAGVFDGLVNACDACDSCDTSEGKASSVSGTIEDAGGLDGSEHRPGEMGTGSLQDEAVKLEPGWAAMDAELYTGEWGSFIRRRRIYDPSYVHGQIRLSELFKTARELAALDPGSDISHDKLLFFDTETTGLGVGAGNVPFMIGLGFWETSGAFVVEQLFIRNPAEELAMLHYLLPLMNRFPYLVSYNGKSFDWPVLKNRFVMNRLKEGLPEPVHLDFLYPSRSLWRNTLPSCRLSKVEESRLGFQREDDVPGSMAPTLYFLYLAEKKPDVIKPVFIHNEHDIVSLAGLAVHFSKALAGNFVTAPMEAEERFRLGLWLHKLGREQLSLEVLVSLSNSILARSDERSAVHDSKHRLPLAAHFKQIGEWDRAVLLWLDAVRNGREAAGAAGPDLSAYTELSMFYEHRARDARTALQIAEKGKEWALRKESLHASVLRRQGAMSRFGGGRGTPLREEGRRRTTASTRLQDLLADFDKRIARLRKKLDRSSSALVPSASESSAAAAPRRKRKTASADESLTLF